MRGTEADAVAFVVGKAIGLVTSTASTDYIQPYHGDASLLTESQVQPVEKQLNDSSIEAAS